MINVNWRSNYGYDERWELYSRKTKEDPSRSFTIYTTQCNFSQWCKEEGAKKRYRGQGK
jgi:hypothetical protein